MSENAQSGKCAKCKHCATYMHYYDEWDEFERQLVEMAGLCECKASPYYDKDITEIDIAGCSHFEAGEGPVYVEGA